MLTQDQVIPGLGNAIARDMLLWAQLHPKHSLADLAVGQKQALYRAILDTIQVGIEQGDRYDEIDLFDRPGGYVRLMDSKALGRPCPQCASNVEKIQYLGGASYVCPSGQPRRRPSPSAATAVDAGCVHSAGALHPHHFHLISCLAAHLGKLIDPAKKPTLSS